MSELTGEAKGMAGYSTSDMLTMYNKGVYERTYNKMRGAHVAIKDFTPSEMSRTEKEFDSVMAVWQEIDNYWREEVKKNWELNQQLAALRTEIAEARAEIDELNEKAAAECYGRELDEQHMEFQVQEIADYRSALEDIEQDDYSSARIQNHARSILEKYPQ